MIILFWHRFYLKEQKELFFSGVKKILEYFVNFETSKGVFYSIDAI